MDRTDLSCNLPAAVTVTDDRQYDYMVFFRDQFREDLWRSSEWKRDIFAEKPKMLERFREILGMKLTKDTAPVIMAAVKWGAETGVIDLEMPKLQFLFSKTERTSRPRHTGAPPVMLTSEEMMSAVREAVRGDIAIREYKSERKRLNDGK